MFSKLVPAIKLKPKHPGNWDDGVSAVTGPDWDDVSAITNPTFGGSGGLFPMRPGKGLGGLGGLVVGAGLGDNQDTEDNIGVHESTGSKNTSVQAVRPCQQPLSCYENGKRKDKEKLQQCRILNAKFAEEMAKRGCPRTKCHTPSFTKSCR